MDRILGGEFPTAKFRRRLTKKAGHEYENDNSLDSLQHHFEKAVDLRRAEQCCLSPCCVRLGLIETMVLVALGPDIRQLVILDKNLDALCDSMALMSFYFPCVDVVSILFRYAELLKDVKEINLETLEIGLKFFPNLDHFSREFRKKTGRHKEMIPFTKITKHFTNLDFFPVIEHVTLSLRNLFSKSGSFSQLTRLSLSSLTFKFKYNLQDMSHVPCDLMARIGQNCPKLQILELGVGSESTTEEIGIHKWPSLLLHLICRNPFQMFADHFLFDRDYDGNFYQPWKESDGSYKPFLFDPMQDTMLSSLRFDKI